MAMVRMCWALACNNSYSPKPTRDYGSHVQGISLQQLVFIGAGR
ncbi:hypothetical protein ACFRAM_05600 [Paenibacillus sp. NPDC056722]